MSKSTVTGIRGSPASSSHNPYIHPLATSSHRTRTLDKAKSSGILRFVKPRNYHRNDSTSAPRSEHHRVWQPTVHSLLQHRQISPIEYDLSLDPSFILAIYHTGYSELSVEQLDAPATDPLIHSMSITCDSIPWSIHISSTATDKHGLMVRDVLEGLHRGLRTKATRKDWENLPSDAKRRVRRAWISRYKRQRSLRDQTYEENQGLRRVDFLCENLAFKGLTPKLDRLEEQHWIMHVGPLKRTVKFKANS